MPADAIPIRRSNPTETNHQDIPDPIELENSFRSSLEDAVTIVQVLSRSCASTQDLTEVLQLALQSDSQLRHLMGLVQELGGKKR